MNNNYNIEMCLWKHESKVQLSPRGIPYYCNKCENTQKKYKPKRNKVREIAALRK